MAFTNLDPAAEPIEDSFSTVSMIPGYKDGISHQWAGKLAKNTSYNQRLVWIRYYDHIRINEAFTNGEEKDFLTATDYAKDWSGVAIKALGKVTVGSDVQYDHRIFPLTTAYQDSLPLYEYTSGGTVIAKFTIKALAAGFRIQLDTTDGGSARTLDCFIVRGLTIDAD